MAGPRALYVEITTHCNLHCAMCPKHGQESSIAEAYMDFSTFERLVPSLHLCRTLRLNGLGEPLLHPRLSEMVALARAHMPVQGDIGFQTNGLLLDKIKGQALLDAGIDTICFSVDSLQPTVNKQHDGSATHAVGQRMLELATQAKGRSARPLSLGCQMVLTRENMHELPEMVVWVARHGGAFLIVSHLLPYTLNAKNTMLFDYDTVEAQKYFSTCEGEANRQGIDLRTYYSVAWKFVRSAAEQQVTDTVTRMLDVSMRRGAPLNLRRLIGKKQGPAPELSDIFARAEHVANDMGLRLDVPRLTAPAKRHCPFSEEGWAFVDVHGAVSPCYFLWHASTCWVDGMRKKVWPVFWGNVNASPLHTLWNIEDWQKFRADSTAWDMPDCFACDMPCVDVKGDFGPFEIDCYGSTAPCGHCPWSQGAMRCMI